jgi:integrase
VECAVSSRGMLGIQLSMHCMAEGELFCSIYLSTQRTFEGWLKGTDNSPSCLHTLFSCINLPKRFPLHCARDHWAVRAARAGTPIAVIQAQLGHGSPMLTLTKYDRFLPSATDRAKWEEEATKYEAARRQSSR